MTGSLPGPLARIKVDEKNCFGMIDWQAVREATSRFLPKHTAAAAWKHRNVSHIEQEGLPPVPKDRGAEQGDVDGPLKCSLALGMVAAEARGSIAAPQAERLCGGTGTTSQRSSVVPMTRGTCCTKTEAWPTNGTWTIATSCVTQSWCCLFYRTPTLPMSESEQSEIH